jgi:hypothetical protein
MKARVPWPHREGAPSATTHNKNRAICKTLGFSALFGEGLRHIPGSGFARSSAIFRPAKFIRKRPAEAVCTD